jgi:hypothetical protein
MTDKERILRYVQVKGRVLDSDLYERFWFNCQDEKPIKPATIDRRCREMVNTDPIPSLRHPEPDFFIKGDPKHYYEPVPQGANQ